VQDLKKYLTTITVQDITENILKKLIDFFDGWATGT